MSADSGLNPDQARRPTLRDIAQAAGVTVASVSRALRNRPKVSAGTRAEILKIARRLGYRPDPEVAKLMNYLRTRRKRGFQSVICAVTTRPTERLADYAGNIAAGAEQRAAELGYGFLPLHITTQPGARAALNRLLRSRGVEGVLVLPLLLPADLSDALGWQMFSAVAATSSLVAPLVHRVAPRHYENVLLLCDQLARRGYRRLGLVISSANDLRVNHGSNAAIMWHNFHENGAHVRPFIYKGEAPSAADLQRWFKRERPDAIVTHHSIDAAVCVRLLGLPVPGRVAIAVASIEPPSDFAGVDELPHEIGRAAVDLLSGLVQRRECGLPASPAALLIQGRWHEGPSCPPRR